jgi:hypothetical protein
MDACGSPARPLDRGTGHADAASPWPPPLPPRRSIRSWRPDASVVTEARIHTRRVTAQWGVAQADNIELIVSELMTNAIQASQADGTITLRLFAGEECFLVCVWDESDELPVIREAAEDEPGGRGLVIVEAPSESCGYVAGLHGGKTVWSCLRR